MKNFAKKNNQDNFYTSIRHPKKKIKMDKSLCDELKRIKRTFPLAQWIPTTKKKGSPTITDQQFYESTIKMNDFKFSKLVDIHGREHDNFSVSYRTVYRATKPQFQSNLRKFYPIKNQGKNHLELLKILKSKFTNHEVDVFDGSRFEEIVGLTSSTHNKICVLDYKFHPGKMVPYRMKMITTPMLPSGDFATQEQNTQTMTALAMALKIPPEDYFVSTDTLVVKSIHRRKLISPHIPLKLESSSTNIIDINGFSYDLIRSDYIYTRIRKKTIRDCIRLCTIKKLSKNNNAILSSAALFYHHTRQHLLNRLEKPPIIQNYGEFSRFLSDTAKYTSN